MAELDKDYQILQNPMASPKIEIYIDGRKMDWHLVSVSARPQFIQTWDLRAAPRCISVEYDLSFIGFE